MSEGAKPQPRKQQNSGWGSFYFRRDSNAGFSETQEDKERCRQETERLVAEFKARGGQVTVGDPCKIDTGYAATIYPGLGSRKAAAP